ncbi:hypothetical protein G3N56_05575 [Desulfovibrio sulfodismutans]|uniref:Uncharacterized protein n=1 Tax=Desulfolutivibrio sulfodismutans TaxID=63561 RepID=A0A7K3NJ34_9BACT|nr:hypothetical protein [Desulfolutivibrio sulfodismutans]NDY56216.1 hypothetical protein [Desulfolutivibrio sulfodismutans]QLA12353.1 hypothetical protein GD606_08740 [Desulfolutivibrio sulfodismutans DSM 3696]
MAIPIRAHASSDTCAMYKRRSTGGEDASHWARIMKDQAMSRLDVIRNRLENAAREHQMQAQNRAADATCCGISPQDAPGWKEMTQPGQALLAS